MAQNQPKKNVYTASIRPREQLMRHGAAALSNVELLELFLRTGKYDKTAYEIAESLIAKHKDIRGIAEAPIRRLSRTAGVGHFKAVQIQAALEMGRRMMTSLRPDVSAVDSPDAAALYFYGQLCGDQREHFMALLLDVKNKVNKCVDISIGTLSTSIVHPREVFREAIGNASHAIIVGHNHPSGDPRPSPEDIEVTKRLVECGRLLGIEVLDHIILGNPDWFSFKNQGLID